MAFSRQKIRKFSVRVGFLEQRADQQFMKSDYPLEDLPSLPPAYVTFRQFLLFSSVSVSDFEKTRLQKESPFCLHSSKPLQSSADC